MALVNCFTLSGLPLSCTAAKAPAGLEGRVWIGFRNELDSITFGTNGDITVLTMAATKKLYSFVSEKRLHMPKQSLIPGAKIALFKHEIQLVLKAKSAAERKPIELLEQAEKMFVLYETVGGQIVSAGIDQHPYKTDLDDERGMKALTSEQTDGGANVNDDVSFKVTMDGTFYNKQKLVTSISATTGHTVLSVLIADLDALTV